MKFNSLATTVRSEGVKSALAFVGAMIVALALLLGSAKSVPNWHRRLACGSPSRLVDFTGFLFLFFFNSSKDAGRDPDR
jgi:hypothetical protein